MTIHMSDGTVHETEFDMTLAHAGTELMPNPESNTHGNPDDYDYEAFQASGQAQAENGHYPDTFKKPNHITFSNESMYHGQDGNEGGQWSKLEGDRWSFTPGATNFKNHSLTEMQDYFKKYEPGNVLNAQAADKPVRGVAENPLDTLKTHHGNHTSALINGSEKQKEAYVELYGYEQSLGIINDSLKEIGRGKDSTGYDTTEWHDEMKRFRDKLLARQGY